MLPDTQTAGRGLSHCKHRQQAKVYHIPGIRSGREIVGHESVDEHVHQRGRY